MIYVFEDCELDTRQFELRRGGKAQPLERQVFDVLAYLVEQHERLVTKEELLDKVWGDRFVSDAALNSRVMAARKAVGDSGREQRVIKTVHGRGYRLVASVSTLDKGSDLGNSLDVKIKKDVPTLPQPKRLEQEIRFSKTPDGVRIAYATVGEGPPLVKVANWLGHLEFEWRSPVWRHWIEELSRDHMLVRYDERGCGLSDWDVPEFSFESWVNDLETVVDTLGLKRFPLLGISQGGPVAITYAVRHPERVSHLILYGTYTRGRGKRGLSDEQLEEREALITLTRAGWGRDNPAYRQLFATSFIPGGTIEEQRWFSDLCRVSTSPENAVRFMRIFDQIDISDLAPKVKAPTLVLHARREARVDFDSGRDLAAAIGGARFVSLESENHILLEEEPAWRDFLREVRQFLGVADSDRRATVEDVHTILFTDIERSTELVHELGDKASRSLFREHEAVVREALSTHGGSEVKTMGDGFMAAFHSATRAVECAVAIQRGMLAHETASHVKVRIGLNAGEPIAEEGDFFGSAVILAARIASRAGGGEILVSEVVRHLVAGKGFEFGDHGFRSFKGFADPVHVYEVKWRD